MPFLVLYLLAGPVSEELGWRGTVHPRLRRGWGRLRVAGVLGTVWAVWHLPLFGVEGTVQSGSTAQDVLFSVLTCYPLTLLLGVAYEDLRGGVAGAVLLHFGHNVGSSLVPATTWVGPATSMALHAALAGMVVVAVRRREPVTSGA